MFSSLLASFGEMVGFVAARETGKMRVAAWVEDEGG
jgi:hypothetical protein